jgi:hypothetical protein
MDWQNIVWIIIALILLFVIFYYVTKERDMLNKQITPGNIVTSISPSSINANGFNSSNFTYSMWFFINDWNYRYGEEKILIGRSGSAITSIKEPMTNMETIDNVDNMTALQPCPFVTLGAKQNNLTISLTCYTAEATATDGVVHNVEVVNVPIQKWVNLFFSVYGRTLDIYINGKLVRTGILPGTAKIAPNADIKLTPNGGFNGWTSKLQYWNNASNPQMAWDTYLNGYGAGLFANIFGKYKVKVSLLADNEEKGQFTI